MKPLIEHILRNASAFSWSLQGMGMLRLHLPDNYRLHIWDSRFRLPGVSMIHDHLQWGHECTIIAGLLVNKRYVEVDEALPNSLKYRFGVLKPGEGCFFKTEPQDVALQLASMADYYPGETYTQEPSEIHETDAIDGTVTLMRKTPTPDESARVFWPRGEEWGSAEPRRATVEEVKTIVDHSLERWFK